MNSEINIFGNPTERTYPRGSGVASRFEARLDCVVSGARMGRHRVDSSRCGQGVGSREPVVPPQQRSRVDGFAAHGVPAYSWWGSLMHTFVVPNASWIAVIVAVSELAIGIGPAIGFLTRTAAFASLALLFTYIMSGTASVSGFYALCAIIELATWRTSTWIGVDGLIAGYRRRRKKFRADRATTGCAGRSRARFGGSTNIIVDVSRRSLWERRDVFALPMTQGRRS